jgi:hypothetical protein
MIDQTDRPPRPDRPDRNRFVAGLLVGLIAAAGLGAVIIGTDGAGADRPTLVQLGGETDPAPVPPIIDGLNDETTTTQTDPTTTTDSADDPDADDADPTTTTATRRTIRIDDTSTTHTAPGAPATVPTEIGDGINVESTTTTVDVGGLPETAAPDPTTTTLEPTTTTAAPTTTTTRWCPPVASYPTATQPPPRGCQHGLPAIGTPDDEDGSGR